MGEGESSMIKWLGAAIAASKQRDEAQRERYRELQDTRCICGHIYHQHLEGYYSALRCLLKDCYCTRFVKK